MIVAVSRFSVTRAGIRGKLDAWIPGDCCGEIIMNLQMIRSTQDNNEQARMVRTD